MAQIDSNIALGYKPIQLESPINQMANMYQLQGAQQSNQLRDMQMQAAQREMEQQNALANAYKQSINPMGELDYEILKRNLATGGQGAQIPGIIKSQREVQKATAEARKADTDAIDSALKTSQALLQQVRTPDQYLAWHKLNHDNQYLAPIFDKLGVTRESARASIQEALQKPGGFENLLQQSQLGIEKFAAMNKPIAVGGSLMTPQGQVIGTAPARETKSDLARKQGELEQLEAELVNDPSNVKIKQRIKEYKDDLRKDTQWKPSTVVMQAPTLSKDALDMSADRFLVDGTLPPGISKANRDAIMNRSAAIAKEKGISPDRVAQLEVTANKQALGQLSKTETMVGAFEKNFVKNVKIVENLNVKKDSTGVPLLQKWINAGKKATSGDPDLASLNIAIKAVQNEYGKIVSGSMGNTAVAVSEIKRMEDLLNAAQTPQDVQAVLNTMKAETQNRIAGFKEQRAELTQSMRGSTTAPTAPAAAAAAPYTDAEKERRYQEWKAKQGGK